MNEWGTDTIQLTATEIELLRQLAEAWHVKPEGKRTYFHIGFEMACGDQDGTFITHPDLPNQMLRMNLIVINKLAYKGMIEIAELPGEQCFSLSETAEVAYRQLIVASD